MRGDPANHPVLIALGPALMLAAVAIEATADWQLDRFATTCDRRGSTKGVCSRGLWGELIYGLQHRPLLVVVLLWWQRPHPPHLRTASSSNSHGDAMASLVQTPKLLW